MAGVSDTVRVCTLTRWVTFTLRPSSFSFTVTTVLTPLLSGSDSSLLRMVSALPRTMRSAPRVSGATKRHARACPVPRCSLQGRGARQPVSSRCKSWRSVAFHLRCSFGRHAGERCVEMLDCSDGAGQRARHHRRNARLRLATTNKQFSVFGDFSLFLRALRGSAAAAVGAVLLRVPKLQLLHPHCHAPSQRHLMMRSSCALLLAVALAVAAVHAVPRSANHNAREQGALRPGDAAIEFKVRTHAQSRVHARTDRSLRGSSSKTAAPSPPPAACPCTTTS